MQGSNTTVRYTFTALAGLALFLGLAGALQELSNAISSWWLGANPPYIAPPTTATLVTITVALASGPAILAVAEVTLGPIAGVLTRTRNATLHLLRWGSDALGLTRLDARGCILAAGATALAFGVSVLVALAFGSRDPADPRFLATAGMSPLEQGLTFAGAGPTEELLFRGPVLIVAALTLHAGAWWRAGLVGSAALVSTAIFAALHPGLDGLVGAGLNGAIWCVLVLLTRSLWPAVISHSTHNLVVGLIAS